MKIRTEELARRKRLLGFKNGGPYARLPQASDQTMRATVDLEMRTFPLSRL
jgi:hypothetical protein